MRNILLTELPVNERTWLESRCTRVKLHVGDLLYHQGDTIDRLYFPDTGVVSLIAVMADGRCAEIAAIGAEGAVGVYAVHGVTTMPCDAVVQVDGEARVLRLEDLQPADARGMLPAVLCQYVNTLLLQVMQVASCNTLHTLRQRAARWMLTVQDRVGRDSYALTQEMLATMLGVRRQSINVVALGLRRAGAVDYRHGRVTVRDRSALEREACECYAAARLRQRDVSVGPPTCACCALHEHAPGLSGSGQISALPA